MFEVQRFWAKDRNNGVPAAPAVPSTTTPNPAASDPSSVTHTTRGTHAAAAGAAAGGGGAVAPVPVVVIEEEDEEEREKSWLLMPILSHPEGCTRCEKMFQTGDILLYFTHHNYDPFIDFYAILCLHVYRE